MIEILTLETIYEGSTFHGVELCLYDITDDIETDITLTGSEIKMDLVRNDTIYATYTTANNTLLIDGNKIIIPEHKPTLPFGVYNFDFSIKETYPTSPSGTKDVFSTGVLTGEWRILNPITK